MMIDETETIERERPIRVLPDSDKEVLTNPDFSGVSDKQRFALLTALKTSGVFVSCGKSLSNVMSTHYGAAGVFWNRDVFFLPIRKSKLSHAIIEQTKSFALSVPKRDMSNEIHACDRLSGYDVNKFEELNLHPAKAKFIPTYTVSECGLFFECKVIATCTFDESALDPDIKNKFYDEKNPHTAFIGEILSVYDEE